MTDGIPAAEQDQQYEKREELPGEQLRSQEPEEEPDHTGEEDESEPADFEEEEISEEEDESRPKTEADDQEEIRPLN